MIGLIDAMFDCFHSRVPSACARVPMRLVDSAFACVCAAMNDLSASVRHQAAELLASSQMLHSSYSTQIVPIAA